MVVVSGAVEGDLDQAVLHRLVRYVGGELGQVHGMRGRQHLLIRLAGYNYAARYAHWTVLMDLDRDSCAPELLQRHLPQPSPFMCCRIAVRSVESWLLADADRLAGHLAVSRAAVPLDPDSLPSPKAAMVNVARRSRRAEIRSAMLPGPRSGRQVGPGYTGYLIGFVTDATSGWRPETAVDASPSLRRCVDALSVLVDRT